jgi:hypothetical protein
MSKFNRQHYSDIAAVFHAVRKTHGSASGAFIALRDAMAAMLAFDNPSFDAAKFRRVCEGVKSDYPPSNVHTGVRDHYHLGVAPVTAQTERGLPVAHIALTGKRVRPVGSND